MICILSEARNEPTTEVVMDWLRLWGVPHVRINGDDLLRLDGPSLEIDRSGASVRFRLGELPFDPGSIRAAWYRRWGYAPQYTCTEVFESAEHERSFNVHSSLLHLNKELNTVSEMLFQTLAAARWLGSPGIRTLNKLATLQKAAALGLDVPRTLVTADPEQAREFLRSCKAIITKPNCNMLLCAFDGALWGTYTRKLTDGHDLDEWPGGFPTLFQEHLEKRYDLRVFYLDGQCHTMAIFSQGHPETSTDFRRYQYKTPNRTVPYRLPGIIEQKLTVLMEQIGLDSGSIDIVRTLEGRYVFLEVNPTGQFGMVSMPCNYHLERKVAEALVERLHEQTQTTETSCP